MYCELGSSGANSSLGTFGVHCFSPPFLIFEDLLWNLLLKVFLLSLRCYCLDTLGQCLVYGMPLKYTWVIQATSVCESSTTKRLINGLVKTFQNFTATFGWSNGTSIWHIRYSTVHLFTVPYICQPPYGKWETPRWTSPPDVGRRWVLKWLLAMGKKV